MVSIPACNAGIRYLHDLLTSPAMSAATEFYLRVCEVKSVSIVLGHMWALLALGWVSQDF